MLERMKATQTWQGGIRLAAILTGAQVSTALANATGHSATVAGIRAGVGCAGESAVHAAIMVGQTLWGTLDACMVAQLFHAAGVLLASDVALSPANAVAGLVGHELLGHVVSFVFQILS